jgi:hypothetical protein
MYTMPVEAIAASDCCGSSGGCCRCSSGSSRRDSVRYVNRGELGVQSLRENTQLQEAAVYPPERPAPREACALEFIRVHLNAPEQSKFDK